LLIGACAGAVVLVATAVETAAPAEKPLALAGAIQVDAAQEETAILQELLADRRAEKEAREAAAQQLQNALEELSGVEDRLAIGDADVLDELDSASPALPFGAQRALGKARNAVESEDLHEARYWIAVAISEAQRAPVPR
jgi:hypothetical protein